MDYIIYFCTVNTDGTVDQMIKQDSSVVHVQNVTIDIDNHRLVVYYEPTFGICSAEFIFSKAPSGICIDSQITGQNISDYADELTLSFNDGKYNKLIQPALAAAQYTKI
jgi:hypothetical protein